MKKSTKILLSILLIVGILVTCTYIYLSFYDNKFFRVAIVTWIMVVIVVFSAFIFEVYDLNSEK